MRLRIAGNAKADFNNLTVTTASGETVNLGDVSYDGRTIDTPLDLHTDAYSIDATVVYYEGKWGMDLICGDIDGKNHNIVSFGRGHSVRVVRDGTAYALAGTEVSMNEVLPGTTWQVHADVTGRGQAMKLYIDGTLIADGTEVKDEPRRTVTVSRNAKAGETYVRVVNAMDEPVDVDLSQILAGLDVSAQSAATATATILAGNDPYAGQVGEESPTKPVNTPLDLMDGTYAAPAWSFTVIALK